MTLRIIYLMLAILPFALLQGETLLPLSDGKPPKNHAELWANYDPRAEPLDVEILKEWEEEGIVLRVVRFRVGVFKGQKSMLAGVYGFPKGGENLPALLNIHGGGQFADHKSVLTNAKRGYATITIAWAGRISAPDYYVGPNEVKCFWEGDSSKPNYRVTTDWAALDAYHAPSRFGEDAFVAVRGKENWTFDNVPSPRNNSWYLCTMGARRALTFLEQQPEVNKDKLGVYGHSMGGKLTIQTAGSDYRVKAAAPSCGGISDRYNSNPLQRNCVGDSPALKNISCPVMFLKPSNDFHSHINDLVVATTELGTNPWRITSSPHLNHRDDPEYEVATQLWFDQYLKGTFTWPKTPRVDLDLKHQSKTPIVYVNPDTSRKILAVDVYYTQQGHEGGSKDLMENRKNRFWHHAPCVKPDKSWVAKLPVFSTNNPIWLYANVTYALDQPIYGAGYYYADYTTDKFVLSSLIKLINPDSLKESDIKVSLGATHLIESFDNDWTKEWYTHNAKRTNWEYRTHKVYHPTYAAPEGARLQLEIKSEAANKMAIGIDKFAVPIDVKGKNRWQTISLAPKDFKDATGQSLSSWKGIGDLRLLPVDKLRSKDKDGKLVRTTVGREWEGANPEFRNLQWSATTTDIKDLGLAMPQVKDHTAMWWRDGFPGKTENADWRRIVKTGNYWFLFDTNTINIARIGASTDGVMTKIKGAKLDLSMDVEGKTYHCIGSGEASQFEGPRLIESGKFLQRSDVTGLIFEAKDKSRLNVEGRFETSAWADELTMLLSVRPGRKPIIQGDSSFGRVNGGFGLSGDNEFGISGEDCKTGETFTLALWAFVPTDFQVSNESPWLVCKENHEQCDGNYGIILDRQAVPSVTINIGGGKANTVRIPADKWSALNIEQWNHLVLNYDGDTVRLWVNGRSAVRRVIGKPYKNRDEGLTIGNRHDRFGDDKFRFRGVIDEVKLYNGAFTPGDSINKAKPSKQWTFRADGQSSDGLPYEDWPIKNLQIYLSNDSGTIRKTWKLPAGEAWDPDKWREVGISFDPVTFQSVSRTDPISVTANEIVTGEKQSVIYEPEVGWHRINLDNIIPTAPAGGTYPCNDTMERIRLSLSNPYAKERVAKLMFEKSWRGISQKIGVPITGVSVVLRDMAGNPTGIPVQLSKNWHFHPEDQSTHSGQWFHGISQLRLPAKSHLELEVSITYGHWGGVAAATHSQLSLVGWGGNQRWDQSAIGAWGESICYSPEQNEASCTITDVRPMMVTSMTKKPMPWGWTNNVGGGDFLRLFDPSGNRIQRSGVVVDYQKQCPCLTEAKYSGGMRGAKISHIQQVSVSRRDDFVIGTYHITMDVNEPFDFSRFAIFQIASDNYATTRDGKLSVGNENGLIAEWDARSGGNKYRGKPIQCAGRIPWVSLHECAGSSHVFHKDKPGAWANRGFIIRKWEAKLGGKIVPNPWIAEYGLNVGRIMETSLIDLVPPPNVKRLEKGDYVSVIIEHLIIPQRAEEYYGPDQDLKSALQKYGDTWKMVHRQAIGDDRKVKVNKGELQRIAPDIRVAAVNDEAEFVLEGGLGYVPITFINLKSHRGFKLLIDGEEVDQSVHGKDFWQTDYDAKNKRWSRTYNIRSVSGKRRVVKLTNKD